MKTQALPRKGPLTRANVAEVAEVAAVTPGARRGGSRLPLKTRPRRTYLHSHTNGGGDTQHALGSRYLRYQRYPGDETPGQTVFSRVADRPGRGATQPLPTRNEEESEMKNSKKKQPATKRPKVLPWTSRRSSDVPGVVMRTPRLNRKPKRGA